MISRFIEPFVRPRPSAAWLTGSVLIACGLAQVAAAQFARPLNAQEARSIGLNWAWFTQVQVDPSRNQVVSAGLVGDRLTVLTGAGVVQELDALTGRALWIAPIGNPEHPSFGPAGNERHVAVINGSTLYVLDRSDGRPVKIRPVGGAPGAAPAIAPEHVFVPLMTGRIEAYPLAEKVLTPWYYQSYGRVAVPPLVTPDSFVWATDAGRLYVGRLEDLGVRYRLETGSDFAAPPAYHRPFVYAANVSGEVFAMHELTGARRWKYATGFPVMRAPAAVEDRVFVTSEEPALHCVDGDTGTSLWEAADIRQFAALSKERVYGVDELGQLVALDAATGTRVARLATDLATHALVNDQTDRIYLISQDGEVQCLHELGSPKPLYHKQAPTEADQPTEEPSPETAESTASEGTAPAEPGAEPEASPFEEAPADGEKPAADTPFGAEDENPFDF
jgi:outer membrane protein assembly factor BamB